MPTPVVAGNWKMNTTVAEAVALVSDLKEELHRVPGVEKVLCPPFVSLTVVHNLVYGSSIKLGAQNMHYEERGAFTGEISPLMVKELCEYVILGHSERRHLFQEADEIVGKKVRVAFRLGLRPILCVGERLEERQAGRAQEVVLRQLRAALEEVPEAPGLVVAYEPVWAIGTGVAATPADAEAIMRMVQGFLQERFSGVANDVPLLYGGSVTAVNVGDFVRQPTVHGVLVGGASLRAQEFLEIARLTARAKGAS